MGGNNSLINWLTSYLVHQAIGTKKGDELVSNPVFQVLSGIVVGHIVQQAGGSHLAKTVTEVGQVIDLVKTGAVTSGLLPDGFQVPTINVL